MYSVYVPTRAQVYMRMYNVDDATVNCKLFNVDDRLSI